MSSPPKNISISEMCQLTQKGLEDGKSFFLLIEKGSDRMFPVYVDKSSVRGVFRKLDEVYDTSLTQTEIFGYHSGMFYVDNIRIYFGDEEFGKVFYEEYKKTRSS
jgi:hypothetical protein